MGIGAGLIIVGSFIATNIATIAVGALVGAAIGGISAAIMGGNILEGVLFGAIGGAVTAGFGAWAGGGGGVVGGTGDAVAVVGTGADAVTTLGTEGVVATKTGLSIGSQLSNVGTSIGTTIATEAGKQIVGQGLVAGISGYMQSEASADAADTAREQGELSRAHDLEKMRLAAELGSSASGGDSLAYKARMAELDQRKAEFKESTSQWREQFDTVEDLRSSRRALFGSSSRGGVTDATNDDGGSILDKRTALSNASGPVDSSREEREVA